MLLCVPLMSLHVWKIDFAHLHLDSFFIRKNRIYDFLGSYLLAWSKETMPTFPSSYTRHFILVGRLIKRLKQCQNPSFCCISFAQPQQQLCLLPVYHPATCVQFCDGDLCWKHYDFALEYVLLCLPTNVIIRYASRISFSTNQID